MKFSENWLREWLDLSIDSDALQAQLTSLGLEVGGVERPTLCADIVTARITAITAHPNASKLRICQVEVGNHESLQIVCGAANARIGLVTALAKTGAELPTGLRIQETKLRGVSSAGMLCSARELLLSEDSAGLLELAQDVPIGLPLYEYLQLDDHLIELELTPNRGDCLSIRGIARDLAARNRVALKEAAKQMINQVAEVSMERVQQVELTLGAGCLRYAGRIISGIDRSARTPLWMSEKLRRCGLRSISLVVDITNYVMLELGQPMHGFDLDKISGAICVRNAKSGEAITLLDGRTLALDDDTLVIADDSGAIGIAGIMGGQSTCVDDMTHNIFFEAAWFDAKKIAGRPRRYDAHTDSAHRFERSVDPQLQLIAIERASQLLLSIAGGNAGAIIDVHDQSTPGYRDTILPLRTDHINRLLGMQLDAVTIREILQSLGCVIEQEEGLGYRVYIPSHRPDIRIEQDLAEEVARVYGYDHITRSYPNLDSKIVPCSETSIPLERIKLALVERGYREAITYSFVSKELQEQLAPGVATLPLANPISADMSVMRTSLWPGLLQALQRNLNRRQTDIRFFESGLIFLPSSSTQAVESVAALSQHKVFAGIVSGRHRPEHWSEGDRELDFYDLKGDLEVLFSLADAASVEFRAASHPSLHPGQSARFYRAGEAVGWLGCLHPRLQQHFSLGQKAFLFEIDADALISKRLPAFKAPSRFPQTRRDISIVVPRQIGYAEILQCVSRSAPSSLRRVFVFDSYCGKGVKEDQKSITLGLILQELSRTLTEPEIETIVSGVLVVLNRELGATLRE